VRFCVCGAGPDAIPLVSIAKLMGWQVSLIDHRAGMLSPERWPGVERILLGSTGEAASAEEIALAIAAEVQAVTSRCPGTPLRGRPGAVHRESLVKGSIRIRV
jgi:xanthine/CO dehydrogenase XdhC/CoxF family maturation factor